MLNILLIDDDPTEFKLIERMLIDCYKDEFVLRYANTLDKAKSIMKSQATDLILLDDKLNHGTRAKQSVPELRNLDDKIPMIVISSNIDAAYLRDKTILDVYDIIDKFHLRKKIGEGILDSIQS